MRTIVILLVLFLSGCQTQAPLEQKPSNATSKEQASLEAFCKQNECRGKTTISIRTAGEEFKKEFPYFWPVIQGNVISVLPGEKLFVEAELVDGKFINLKHIKENTRPERTFVIELSQNEKDFGMLLALENPFHVRVKFDMKMMDFRGGLHSTSSCPAIPGAFIYENWPHPIVQLYIENPRVLAEGEPFRCE